MRHIRFSLIFTLLIQFFTFIAAGDFQLISAKIVEIKKDYILVNPDRCPNHTLKVYFDRALDVDLKKHTRIMFITVESPCINKEIKVNKVIPRGFKR
ncbi:MAG: hypothetical protein Q9N26_03700 [Aquificota bacterium]|nr:hypothetical protein [Aquificota bacterium]